MYLSEQKVRELCKRRGIGLGEVLQEAGVSRTAYYSLVRKDSIVPKSVTRLAGALEVPVSALLNDPDKEREILKKANSSEIGPMGFGGTQTVLAVKAKAYPTHIAGLPVAVNISCHALRSARGKL